MVSLITVGLVNNLNMARAGHSNVKEAGFRVNGVTLGYAPAAILETSVHLGFRRSFHLDAHLTIIDSERYKLILGMDILGPMNAEINLHEKLLQLTYNGETKKFRLLNKQEVRK